jgi:DNA polymerase-1
VHDAVLIEADAGQIDDAVVATREAMAEASRIVLGGLEVDTDVKIIGWPHRYADDRGQVMWERISEILSNREGQGGQGGQQVKEDRKAREVSKVREGLYTLTRRPRRLVISL